MILSFIGIFSLIIYWQIAPLMTDNYSDNKYLIQYSGFQYDLINPKKKYLLDDDLQEISGLSFFAKDLLGCIQDEDGKIFLYNKKSEQIEKVIKFGKDGDYEGIEIVGDTVYILKSNGNVYCFYLKNGDAEDLKKIETHLTSSNDTEGLCYEESKNRLLIVCKSKNDSKKFETDDHAIYQITLNDLDFKKDPAYTFSKEYLKSKIKESGLESKKHLPFKPSGIAIHPISKNIYIISSVSKLLVILNKQGKIESVAPLKRKVFTQPEGICFDKKGNLFISSEGRGGSGYILEYDLRK